MKDTAKVEGHAHLVRDLKSQAIINTDSDAYARYMARKRVQKQRNDELREVIRDVNELKIEMEKDDLGNKPVDIKEKIVEGRIQKKLKEMVLVDQAFIRDSSMTIGELVKQNISTLGENIQIHRFERFVLGEGLEKKNEDFGAEVEKMMSK
mgnify:CR=1 FL=1